MPLDEALVQAVVDVAGRPYVVHEGEPEGQVYAVIGGTYTGSLTRHVLESFATTPASPCTCACWPAATRTTSSRPSSRRVARALRAAVARDPRVSGIPSAKGSL